jgi:arylsulfatase A-like enzyme
MTFDFMVGGLVLAGSIVPFAGEAQHKSNFRKQPNVVFILADDLGYGDLGCYGQEKFPTPNIDKLAQDGMRFTRFYSGTTVSAPSRSCLLTGTHSGHTPIRGNVELKPEGQYPLPSGTRTFFHDFKSAGYVTGVFGKWGLGFVGSTGDPSQQGVDEFFGFNCQLLAHSYYPSHLWHNDVRIDLPDNTLETEYGKGTYSPDLIHQNALDFIDAAARDEKPFFLWYPTVLPHAELIVPEDSIIKKFRGKFPETPFKGCEPGNPGFRKGGYCTQFHPRATFAAMIYRLDVYVGQLVQKLKDEGVYDNTIIIFSSDNGPHQEGGADPDFFNSNGILRGYKRDLYEGGVRVPMIVAWPGHVAPSSQSDLMATFWDLMPTFNDILSTKTRVASGDGHSILPTLIGTKGQKEHDFLYFEFQEMGGRQAVIQEAWKLVKLNIRGAQPVYELYNLNSDPSERHNRINDFPGKVADLMKVMESARIDNPDFPLFKAN